MGPIVASVEISRRPEDVFAYITNPSHLPEWQESVVRVNTNNRSDWQRVESRHDAPLRPA